MRGEFVDIGAQRLYYYAAGTRGVGALVVFLHGFPMSSRLWHHVVRDFPTGHRMVICDLPGFGRSDPSPTPRTSCEAHADAIVHLLDDLQITSAAIVGHGLGGGVAQALALRVAERVSHLALVSSAAFGVRPARMARFARFLGPLAKQTPPTVLAGLVHGSMARGFAHADRSRLALDACLQPFTTPSGRDALAAHLAALSHCDTSASGTNLGMLSMPTAIIWGRDDPFYPVSLGERLAAAIPDATFDVIDGASHFVPEDTPDQLIRALSRLLVR